MDTFLQDIRFAVRSMARRPGVTLIAVLCLTLGIAANTTVFSCFNAILLRPFDFREPDRIAYLEETHAKSGDDVGVSWPTYRDWREQSKAFSEMAALTHRSLAITEGEEPERVSGAAISANLFAMLGVQPQVGRLFRADEDEAGSPNVALLSDALWQRRFRGDSSVVGRTVQINGAAHTIVGVMPARFKFPFESELWTNAAPYAKADRRDDRYYMVFARLATGATLERANTELAALSERLMRQYEPDRQGWVGRAIAIRDLFTDTDVKTVTIALMGAVTFVLLIACANVANLMLARATARRREMAVRAAIGAGRARIVRQLLTESVVLALVAGVLAIPLTRVGLNLIDLGIPAEDPVPYYIHWSLDTPTLVYTMFICLVTGVVFGLAPALQAARAGLQGALKEGGRGSSEGAAGHRVRHTLVAAEVGLSLVLLVGASLFIRSFLALQETPVGFDVKPLLTMRFYMPGTAYDSIPARAQRTEDIVRRIEALPGVLSAASSDLIPLDGGMVGDGAVVEGRDVPRGDEPRMVWTGVTEHWFETIGVSIRSGRSLTAAEARDSLPMAVINQRMAQLLWPNDEAVGRRFRRASDSSGTWFTVVGVVNDFLNEELDDTRRAEPSAYLGWKWLPVRNAGLVVRVRGDPSAAVAQVRQAIRGSDPGLPVFNVASMDRVRSNSFWQYGLFGSMFSTFGGIALFLAGIGIYGVMSFGVAQRTQEIGVRMAMGAQQRDVLRMIVGQGIRLAAIGVAVGLVGALGVTRVVSSLLVGVTATDPVSFIGVAAFLTLVAVLASFFPARRATSVDPVRALRGE